MYGGGVTSVNAALTASTDSMGHSIDNRFDDAEDFVWDVVGALDTVHS